jgi:peroxiredoxin Q/BCP
VSIADFRGTTVVLYFYPKDDTSGCTRESCEFRDLFPRFAATDAVVLGISPDSVKSHQKFKQKYALPFTLLADENHALAERLGIWVEKLFYGRKYMGVQRTTYVIGPHGDVQHVFEKVNPAGHAGEVMAFLKDGVEAALAVRAAHDSAVGKPVQKKPATKTLAKKKPAKGKPAKKPAKKATSKMPAKKKTPPRRPPAAKRPAPRKRPPAKK